MMPVTFTLTIPFGTLIVWAAPVKAVPLMLDIVGVVPSISLSLANKLSTIFVSSSLIVRVSGLATGASGVLTTGPRINLPMAFNKPSLTV